MSVQEGPSGQFRLYRGNRSEKADDAHRVFFWFNRGRLAGYTGYGGRPLGSGFLFHLFCSQEAGFLAQAVCFALLSVVDRKGKEERRRSKGEQEQKAEQT